MHIEAGQLPAVRAVMREMRKHGVKPGPVSICQMLKACELEATPMQAKAAAVDVWKLVLVTHVRPRCPPARAASAAGLCTSYSPAEWSWSASCTSR